MKYKLGDKIVEGELLQTFDVVYTKYKKVYAVKTILDGEEHISLVNEEDIINN
jgi:hypothetical protein